ncbi:MAG: hypothetical protein R3325_04565 [Thermoanaerobaculia bacterium]|nr:hypothetical protein [Thermoanaerobaculia bacterium]
MRKKLLLPLIAAGCVVGLADAGALFAKAHVPLGRAQICTASASVKTVSGRRLSNELGKGACRLTACVFNEVEDDGHLIKQYIFFSGDDCDPTDDDGDGFCDAVGYPRSIPRRLKANNLTPACTDPF